MGISFLVFLAALGAIVVFVIVFPFRPLAFPELDRSERRPVPKVSFGS